MGKFHLWWVVLSVGVFVAKLVETGTYAGDEDDDVLFDEMVDDYEDEDEAIDAVSTSLNKK